MVNIEVAVATSEKQAIIPLTVPVGTDIKTAVELSGILAMFPALPALADFAKQGFSVGVFGKLTNFDSLAQNNDRIEIYFPLKQSAIDARKARAKAKSKKI